MIAGHRISGHHWILDAAARADRRCRSVICTGLALALLCSLILGSTGVATAMAQGPASFTEGFIDLPTLGSANASVRDTWLDRAKETGATAVRFSIEWSAIAPKRLTRRFRPADPGDRRYGWDDLDAVLRDATTRGLNVLLTIYDAPLWAQGKDRPRSSGPGSWKPSPRALGAFAHALAARYSGTFPDPVHPGATLPRVRWFQAWNEPNLPLYLAPQWIRSKDGSFLPASPGIYREMLNAVYKNVKAAQPDAYVLSAGTEAYGDPPGAGRMPPTLFMSELLCLQDRSLRPEPCPHPAHFDAVDHHPYAALPTYKAANPADISVGDLARLERIVRVAERSGRALPRGPKPLWITEIGWGTRPPNPHGIAPDTQTRYLALAFYTLWRQGVDHVFWFTLRDSGHAFGGGGGLYFGNGDPKPATAAFRFPFVAVRAGRQTLTLWGRAPLAGTVSIEREVANAWQLVVQLQTTPGGVFHATRALGRHVTLRAVQGAVSSPPWTTG